MGKNWGNKKVDENDYVKLIVIVGVLVLAYFVYSNFVPKNIGGSLSVDVIEISVDCKECVDSSTVVDGLSSLGVGVDDYDTYSSDSAKGKKMIEKYGITRLPALILTSRHISEMGLEGAFDVKDNYAVFNMNVPYVDMDSGEVEGLVRAIEVSPNCENCFSLSSLKGQLEKMGIRFADYRIVGAESVEGLAVIQENKLTFAPALLISKDIDKYDWIVESIKSSLEDRGEYYLLKSPVAPYKDLVSDSVRGVVSITLLNDSSCEDCFDVGELRQAFQQMGVYFVDEKILDVSSVEGKAFVLKYNVTKVPTLVLSKEILDYAQLREVLGSVGTFDDKDQSFVFRKIEDVGEYVEVDL